MSDLWTAPAVKARAVTPSDTTVVACRGLYVGTAGTVVGELFDDADGQTTTIEVPDNGTFLPISFKRIYSTGTDASNMVALY